MKRYIFVCLLVFLTTAVSLGEDWVWLSDNSKGDKYYYDRHSVEYFDDFIRVWVLHNYVEPGPYGVVKSKIQYDYAINARRQRTVYSVYYGANDSVILYEKAKGPDAEWEPIVPGSVPENIWTYCTDEYWDKKYNSQNRP